MPIYEFRCRACQAEFEELVPGSDPEALARVACPECGHGKVIKKISAFAAGVKGEVSNARARAAECAPSG
jgi:putative FmdB family regulatory protein